MHKKKEYDVVYPLNKSSRHKDRELSLSIRSLGFLKYKPRNVVVIGEKPKQDISRSIATIAAGYKHIPYKETERKCMNLAKKLLLACQTPGISDPFLYMYDDVYFLQPLDRFTHFFNGLITNVATKDSYFKKIYRITVEHLKKKQLPLLNYETHRPILIDKTLYEASIKDTPYDKAPGVNVRSLYLNFSAMVPFDGLASIRPGGNIKKSGGLKNQEALQKAVRKDGIVSLPHKVLSIDLDLIEKHLNSTNL